MDALKTSAEAWRRRLVEKLSSLDDVQTWADQQIAALDRPPTWLIDVSMARDRPSAITALGNAEGEADKRVVWCALMAGWRDLLEREPSRDSQIAEKLYFLGQKEDPCVPADRGELMYFCDAIDLAREGTWGSLDDEREKLREFLARWSAVGALPNPPWQTDGASRRR